MLARIITIALLLTTLSLLTACEPPQATPEQGNTPAPTPTPVSVLGLTATPSPVSVPTPTSTPTSTPMPTNTPAPVPSYLTDEIPPCTPISGSPVDPCEPDAPPIDMGIAQYVPELGDEPLSVREMLDDDSPPPAWVRHIVLRGTYLPGTVRCIAGDPFRPPSYLQAEFGDIADERSLKCYIDMRANVYILGSGPSTLTTLLFRYSYWDHQYTSYLEGGQTEQDFIEEFGQQIETAIDDLFPGREHIVFLGPDFDLSSEVWRILGIWDVQRREDGTVIAVHPDRDLWRRLRPDDYQTHLSALEMELPAFTQAVTAAHQARVTEYDGRIGADTSLPMLVTNANQLREYYTEVGAYAPGAPTPAQPPPPCGLAVPDQGSNPGLMRDCMALLAAKDPLRGTATLNWSVERPITSWEGVRVRGTPGRVHFLLLADLGLTGVIPPELGALGALRSLDLDGNELTGEIPAELGDLSNLVHLYLFDNGLSGAIPATLGGLSRLTDLWLNNNELTGEIPAELGEIPDLEEIYVAGNSFTGCVPPGLRAADGNDLDATDLRDCGPADGA